MRLWHTRFDYVLAFQARPSPLTADVFYRGIDERLSLASPVYRERTAQNPQTAVYLKPSERLTGEARYGVLRSNLLEVLHQERVLLVVDNFETNLQAYGESQGYACQDPEWERLLSALATELATAPSI